MNTMETWCSIFGEDYRAYGVNFESSSDMFFNFDFRASFVHAFDDPVKADIEPGVVGVADEFRVSDEFAPGELALFLVPVGKQYFPEYFCLDAARDKTVIRKERLLGSFIGKSDGF